MSLPSYTIADGTINGFLDNQIVQANTGTNAMNPKMSVIGAAINDHAATLDVLQGQISILSSTASSVQFNVKASTYGAKGDGVTDDTAAIQKAINDAVSAQGIVVFPTGIYKITDKLTVAGNCSLTSDGASAGSYISQYTVAESIYITGSNVSVSNLIFKTHTNTSTTGVIANPLATAASPHSNISITGCQFYDYGSNVINGIVLYHASNVRIENCSFTTSVGLGVVLYSCSKAFIYRNTFATTNVSVTLTRKSGTLTSYPQTRDVFVSQNNITPVSMTGSNYVISIVGAINTYVDRNNITIPSTVTTTFNYAIASQLSDTYLPAYIQITDNYIDNSAVTGAINYFSAVNLGTSSDIVVSRNVIIDCYNAIQSIGSSDLLISNNTIISPNAKGIYVSVVDATSILSGNIIVSGNSIVDVYNASSSAYAIRVDLFSTITSGVTVIGNSVRRGTKTSTSINTYGLYVSPSVVSGLSASGAYVSCSGNTFSACSNPIAQSGTLFWVYYELPTGDRVFYSPTGAAPTVGTWNVGDQVVLASPTAGGYIGYVCTTAGTPGTWKGYGAIQA